MTTIALSARGISHRSKSLGLPVFNWKAGYGLAIMTLAGMLVVYVVLINNLTQGSYLIKSYNKQMDALLTQNKNLQTSFAESGFLGNVQNRVSELSFEKTTQITYVQILDNSLGMAK
jgi:hypothetical protein